MMGYYAIYALTAAANGDEVSDVPTAGYWYDATNMEDEEIAPNLYDEFLVSEFYTIFTISPEDSLGIF